MNNDKKMPETRQDAIAQGKRHYFTGKACKRGHLDRRRTIDSSCVSCQREAQQEHRDEVRRKLEAAEAILAGARLNAPTSAG